MVPNPEINLSGDSELGVSDSNNEPRIRASSDMYSNSAEERYHGHKSDPEKEEYKEHESAMEYKAQEDPREADIVWHYLTFDIELPHPTTIYPEQPGQEPPPEPPNLVKYTNPFDWSESRKSFTVWISCVITALTAFSAGAYTPGVEQMTEEWGVSSVAALVGITTFTTGFAIAPMVLAPFSEINGRRPVFLASGILFVICQLCSGLTQSYAGMLVVRFFLGIGGSTFSTMVGGVVSDIYHAQDRNTPMALFSGSALFGTSFGPLVCGFIAQNTTWRWIFYVQAISCGMMVALICVVFKETRGSVLLSRKAKRLNKWYEAREAAGYYGVNVRDDEKTGSMTSQRLRWKVRSDEERASLGKMIGISLYRPFHLLFTEPVVFWFSLWVAFSWAVLYLTLAAIPLVFQNNHGFSLQQANAVFASMGIASILATILSIYQEKIAKRHGKATGTPEGRLYFACIESACMPIGLFMFGWTSFSEIHWVVPAIAIGIATIGIFSIYLATFNFLADTYHRYASSALAAQSFCRNMLVALTRFKRTLPYVRPAVRELTHTMRFPPAHAELYDGPHAEWLRDCLEYLPRLQCLIVDGLPFFDHACLLSLRYPSLRRKSIQPNAFPVFSLRLLDASGCTNATSTGLAEALPHFPDLVSLDLSKTAAAKDKAVLAALTYLRNLRFLNLRGLGMKDDDFAVVAHAIRSQVRSLDISDNYLTDTSTRLLLELCLKETIIAPHAYRGPLAPVEYEQSGNEMDAFETENLVGHLRKKLTEGFVGSLAIEEARDLGISHLYLSKNSITIEGIFGLLRSGRLQVLDAGILPATIRNPYPEDPGAGEDDMELPSAAKLIPILAEFASHKLRYLRLNFQILTEDAPIEVTASPRVELCGDLGVYKPSDAHELEAIEPPTPELDSEITAIYETPGDSSHPIELPGSFPSSDQRRGPSSANDDDSGVETSRSPAISTTSSSSFVKRGPAYAPEPVLPDSSLTLVRPSQQRDENNRPSSRSDWIEIQGGLVPTSTHNMPPSPATSTIMGSRGNSFYYIEDRKSRLEHRQSDENCLHPGMLPNLHTLVLTEVPINAEKYVIDRIIQFIKDAAEEALIARQRAKHTYVLPPGRRRAIAEQEYASSLFALKRVVLEMASPQSAPKKISTSWRAYPTKSTTQDADSEAFWEAASHDFSFFGDEECGLPGGETGRTLPLAAMGGLELAPSRNQPPPECRNPKPDSDPRRLFDVVGAISKFRKERKAAYTNLVQMGEADPELEGYWPGSITVMRKQNNPEAGEVDCYGNRYESGWYYR
ncbi:leucine rich repeat protein [Stemphylium lycopersici]|nr:leucine rich repeat protein [Stemphylium lycopersici]